MVKHNQLNTLLMEILIVVLFFALCSTVILDVFVGAHNQSARAGAQARRADGGAESGRQALCGGRAGRRAAPERLF